MTLYSIYYDVTAGRGTIIEETANSIGSSHSDYLEFDQTFSDIDVAIRILDEKNAKL